MTVAKQQMEASVSTHWSIESRLEGAWPRAEFELVKEICGAIEDIRNLRFLTYESATAAAQRFLEIYGEFNFAPEPGLTNFLTGSHSSAAEAEIGAALGVSRGPIRTEARFTGEREIIVEENSVSMVRRAQVRYSASFVTTESVTVDGAVYTRQIVNRVSSNWYPAGPFIETVRIHRYNTYGVTLAPNR